MRHRAVAIIGLSILALGCEERNRVRLSFGEKGEGFYGFTCRDTTVPGLLKPLVIERAKITTTTFRPTYAVVDLVRLGGDPGCRTAQLLAWCEEPEHECVPLPSQRMCVPLDLSGLGSVDGIAEIPTAMIPVVKQLAGVGITSDAPDEPVVVRLVATLEDCASLALRSDGTLPPYDQSKLLGCAYGGPVRLDSVRGSLFMGFDSPPGVCSDESVNTCADIEYRPPTLAD